jgi:osmoprotectant transport system permease protein
MIGLFHYAYENRAEITQMIIDHLSLCGLSLLSTCIISGIICIFCRRNHHIEGLIHFFSFLRLIPGIAILIVSMPIFGVGFFPSAVSLTVLGIPSILVNTWSGMKNIAPSIIESAGGLGLTEKQILFHIQLPMALPFVLLGLRTAVVDVITIAAVASLMGAGGLGRYILTGLLINNAYLIIIGGGSITAIALFSEGILGYLQRRVEKTMSG